MDNSRRQPSRHFRRQGFATFEIFIVSPLMLAIGLAISFCMRWLLGTTHWASWSPAAVLGIPFLLAYGVIMPGILYMSVRERFTSNGE